MTAKTEMKSRSTVLRGEQGPRSKLGWLASMTLVALLGLFMSGAAYAAGTGDHDHEEAGPVVEEVSKDAHDNTDGHHDAPVEPMHDNADGHHDAPVEPVHDNADGHHDAPVEPVHENADGHHDAPVEPMHENADGHHDEMEASGEHDHSAHEDGTWASNNLELLFAWAGKLHPAATNFPIALLFAAFLAEAMFMVSGNSSLRNAARFCLWAGAISAAGTVVLGWGFVGFDTAGDDSILSAHRWNGTAVGILSLLTLWLGERTFTGKGSAVLYRVALVTVALMVSYNGLLGGKMVYGEDHYARPTLSEA